ncbi:MAG: hypothetical protein KC493_08055 [Bacteriovoracaceae bacterium]|nr:hypothetical protein [Bacteriovoracaceae bacterium]
MSSQVIFQIQSTLILCLIYIGLYYRQFPTRHVKIMAISITWDLLLILQIELTRGAVEKASKALSNPMLLNFHIAVAVFTVVLYFALIYTGRKMLAKDYSFQKMHRLFGRSAVLCRTITYITSYMVVSH